MSAIDTASSIEAIPTEPGFGRSVSDSAAVDPS